MPSNLLTPFLELDDEFSKSFQGPDARVGFQRRHSLCPVTLPNSKFNLGGAGAPTDDPWSLTGNTFRPWTGSDLQRIPFWADRSVSMIEGRVSRPPPPPPGLNPSPLPPPGLSSSPPPPPGLNPSPLPPPGLSPPPPGGLTPPLTPPSPAAAAASARYKTELCRTYEESGACKYGAKCQFAHGAGELRGLSRHPRYKTEPCRTFHTAGFCPYGARCHFIHNADEAPGPRPGPRDRPRLLRQSVSFAGFPSTAAAFQAPPDQAAFSRSASASPPPWCSPDPPSPPPPGPVTPGSWSGFGSFSRRTAALQRSPSADSLSDHDGYSSSGSLSGCDSPGAEGARRLPIFSRLSVSED